MTGRHPNDHILVLINDPYSDEASVKDSQHQQRAQGKGQYHDGSKNIFIKPDERFPARREFAQFFKNKKRLQGYLKNEFRKYAMSKNIKLLYSVKDECWDLGSGMRKEEFECEHAEADTIILYIYHQLRKMGVTDTVVIDAEDTDVQSNSSSALP